MNNTVCGTYVVVWRVVDVNKENSKTTKRRSTTKHDEGRGSWVMPIEAEDSSWTVCCWEQSNNDGTNNLRGWEMPWSMMNVCLVVESFYFYTSDIVRLHDVSAQQLCAPSTRLFSQFCQPDYNRLSQLWEATTSFDPYDHSESCRVSRAPCLESSYVCQASRQPDSADGADFRPAN